MFYRWDGQDLVLQIKVVPNAARNEFAGEHHGRLKIKIAGIARDGKANRLLRAFLAKSFGVTQRQVVIESGENAREKRIRINNPTITPDFLPE